MSLVLDVTADQPPPAGQWAVQELTPEEVAPLAEELVAYHQHFAPLFYRREQREWAEIYVRGLLTADVPRKNVEAMALRLLGVGSHAERQIRALQHFIGEGKWDDDARLSEHQRLVNERLSRRGWGAHRGRVRVSQARGSRELWWRRNGVGTAAKRTTARLASRLRSASRKGATLLDRRLYLPESWFDEDHQTRWQDCQIPEEIACRDEA